MSYRDTGLEQRLPISVISCGTQPFVLSNEYKQWLRSQPYDLGYPESKFGEIVFMRTYSRRKDNGGQEDWYDCVIRVIEGLFTIRKWWFETHHLPWNREAATLRAQRMALSMLRLHWSPPGRGCWILGTDYAYDRGSMALNNCGFVLVEQLDRDIGWTFDALLNGVGVGHAASRTPQELHFPLPDIQQYTIQDCREDWVNSVVFLLRSYIQGSQTLQFDYNMIRGSGEPIAGFGGVSSGSQPLQHFHQKIRERCEKYIRKEISWTILVTDLSNLAGVCAVAGNIRRSAELALGSPQDIDFLDLKDYERFPERMAWGHLSNNTVVMEDRNDFLKIPDIVKRIVRNGEPGFLNRFNVQKYGCFGDERYGVDAAIGTNPCSEVLLEPFELCCLAETYPSRVSTRRDFLSALEDSTFYASTISLYPTHSELTNQVVSRNHRIGVSLSGVAEWCDQFTLTKNIRWLKDGYALVRRFNDELNKEAGVRPSIRTTCIKPSGSMSQVAGCTPGMHWSHFYYALRRILIAKNSPLVSILSEAGYPFEDQVEFVPVEHANERTTMPQYQWYCKETPMVAVASETSVVFEVPIRNDKCRETTEVSIWEQFSMLATLQREFADNSVSCTILYNPDTETEQLEHAIAAFMPVIKSVSILPHTQEGVYPQSPYSRLTAEEYTERVAQLKPINWTQFSGDGIAPNYCDSDKCEVSFLS